MLETIKKKKPFDFKTQEIGSKIICGACSHVRTESDSNPAWQCPNCKSAYVKVQKKSQDAYKNLTQAELKAKNHAFLQKSKEKREKQKKEQFKEPLLSSIGVMLFAGVAEVASKFSSCTCSSSSLSTPAKAGAIFFGITLLAMVFLLGFLNE
ncbi:hypothetical protein [Motiliproteus sp. SC1-56]|uniref:hypothetical protein n=1 Tax=Motiliproteus sp. SC1-56 TaxID=2799565 RepID=UPI001A8C3B26|nr:hypothetical protein [Motiliproteus sp. SC1-56]